jgi:hypothetical protein
MPAYRDPEILKANVLPIAQQFRQTNAVNDRQLHIVRDRLGTQRS